jgi:hypothetical protein
MHFLAHTPPATATLPLPDQFPHHSKRGNYGLEAAPFKSHSRHRGGHQNRCQFIHMFPLMTKVNPTVGFATDGLGRKVADPSACRKTAQVIPYTPDAPPVLKTRAHQF